MYLHYVEADADSGGYEHDGGVDFIITRNHSFYGHVDENAGDHPNHQHWYQRSHYLWWKNKQSKLY